MQTQEAPVREAAPEQRPEATRRNRMPWLIAVAAILGLVAVGLVIWASDDASDPQLETVTELVDTMHEGLNENDIDTFTSVFTDDAAAAIAPLIAVDIDPEHRETLAHALVGLAEGASRRLVGLGRQFDPDEVARVVSGLAWAGLRATHRVT